MAEEMWRTINGWARYEVSNRGRVRRIGSIRVRRQAIHKLGYRYVSFYDLTAKKWAFKTIHRMVCEAFRGPAPSPSHEAAHNDGDRGNNNADNLRWATPKENSSDKVLHGTLARGEKNGSSKLTDEQVAELRSLYETVSISQRRLAAKFGINQSQVSRILCGHRRGG